jgi:hypothetical protein
MKLPNKIKVGPFLYTIEHSSDIAAEGNCYGSTHHNSHKIFIDPKVTEVQQRQTLIHEIMHVCVFINGLTYRLEKDQKVTEEDLIREMSMTFFQVMEDNKEFFKWITK